MTVQTFCSMRLKPAIPWTRRLWPTGCAYRKNVAGIGGDYYMEGGDPIKTKFRMVARDGAFVINEELS